MSLALKFNPDWQAAEIHGKSTKPGIPEVGKHKREGPICPCCHNYIHKIEAPLCQNSKELQFLGFGFPLFYVFIKYCIILLLVNDSCYNAIMLFWSISSGQETCSQLEGGCTSVMIQLASISKKVSSEEQVLRVFSFIMHLGSLLYIRDLITKTRNYYDQRTTSLSDYSLILHNLPKRKGTKKNLLKFLSQSFDKSPTQVTFLPQYEVYYKMEQDCIHVINQMKVAMRKEESEQQKKELQQLQAQLTRRQNKLETYCNNQLKQQENDQCVAEKLIFSCETEDDKCKILQGFQQVSQEKLRQAFQILPEQECLIRIDQAPEPKEINWESINYPESKRVIRMIVGWILTITFLGAITGCFFFILAEKSQLIEHSTAHSTSSGQYTSAIFIVYLAIVSVICFNKFVMGLVLHHITDFQKHQTTAQEEFHFALKYSVGMFFTTALMTLAVQDLKYSNFYQHPYGVIEEQTVMFILNAFFVPLIWLINPWQIHVLIRRKFNYGRKDLTQKQANKMMENVQYNMGKRYAQILQIMWFTYLYDSLVPLGGFLSAIGLSLYYWVDKYNLLRRSSVNSNIAGQLPIYAMKLLDFTLICKPIGEILFDSQIRESYCLSSVITASIGLIYLISPTDQFLEYFHSEKFNNEEKPYSAVEKSFKETYQTLHPIFSQKRQNQQRLFAAFHLMDEMMEESVQIFVKPPQPLEKSQKSQKKIAKAIMNNEANSPAQLNEPEKKLQILIKKHDYYNFKEKEKEKVQQKESNQ